MSQNEVKISEEDFLFSDIIDDDLEVDELLKN
jgi:hypothetical protein